MINTPYSLANESRSFCQPLLHRACLADFSAGNLAALYAVVNLRPQVLIGLTVQSAYLFERV